MATVGLVHRRDVWGAGLASLVLKCGLDFLGEWPSLTDAADILARDPPDLLILSKRLIDGHSRALPLDAPKRPAVIILLDPDDRILPKDLNAIPVEAFLMSDAAARTVENCIKAVASGHAWIDPSILRPANKTFEPVEWTCLSERELEVAHLAATGLSNKRIALRLRLSDGTIKVHMHHILAKLHLARRADLSEGDAQLGSMARRQGHAS